MSRVEIMNQRNEDQSNINEFVDVLFSHYPDGIYFDEFVDIAKHVASDLFSCIYDCFYRCVPCVQNFLLMKAHFKFFMLQNLQMPGSKHSSYIQLQNNILNKML